MRHLQVAIERWPIAGNFTISRGSRTEAVVVVATITDGKISGHGECVPYARYGESAESVVAQIQAMKSAIADGLTREALLQQLPPGAARNALDCALWDFETHLNHMPLYALAGMPRPAPLVTAFTISLGTPEVMYNAALAASERPLLKIKLGSDGDSERLQAVRKAAPKARLIVDANEAWRTDTLAENIAACEATDVELIEQPLPAENDKALAAIKTSIIICADESIHDAASLAHLPEWYTAINIKLDKTGGLTDALALYHAARKRKLRIMIGCMVGTSLAMRPAIVLAQSSDFIDLDGPLLLAKDRSDGLQYQGSTLIPPW